MDSEEEFKASVLSFLRSKGFIFISSSGGKFVKIQNRKFSLKRASKILKLPPYLIEGLSSSRADVKAIYNRTPFIIELKFIREGACPISLMDRGLGQLLRYYFEVKYLNSIQARLIVNDPSQIEFYTALIKFFNLPLKVYTIENFLKNLEEEQE